MPDREMMHQIKKLLSSVVIIGLLTYVLIVTDDRLTHIVVILFLTFALAYFLQYVFLVMKKPKMATAMSKVYVIAFAVYWFGFLVVWDYLSIVNKNYVSLLVSLLPWLGGGWIIYRKLKRKS